MIDTLYRQVGRVTAQHPLRNPQPEHILLVRPCCIGDVVLATAALQALRQTYPQAHIAWAVGGWSRAAVEHHPLLDAVLDTGPAANPVRTPGGMWRFVRTVRAGRYDLAVSLVRSPLMSLALLLSGIPDRVGLDSGGRGFGYTLRVPVNPAAARSEGEIYLDAVRALAADTTGCWANIPVQTADRADVAQALAARGIEGPYVVLNPTGGRNPGMTLDVKRWPPANFVQLGAALVEALGVRIVLVGGPGDEAIVAQVAAGLDGATDAVAFVGELSFGQIAALAADARGYIGNDTGLTHLAAAAGARTVMILGPSDPARYAPFVADALTLWKPGRVGAGGVSGGVSADWTWARDGIGAEDVIPQVIDYLTGQR